MQALGRQEQKVAFSQIGTNSSFGFAPVDAGLDLCMKVCTMDEGK
jgi:hypothetical protein